MITALIRRFSTLCSRWRDSIINQPLSTGATSKKIDSKSGVQVGEAIFPSRLHHQLFTLAEYWTWNWKARIARTKINPQRKKQWIVWNMRLSESIELLIIFVSFSNKPIHKFNRVLETGIRFQNYTACVSREWLKRSRSHWQPFSVLATCFPQTNYCLRNYFHPKEINNN